MRGFRFAIDRGGTFTDVYAEMDVLDAQGNVQETRSQVTKLLSEDPANYPDAPRCVFGCGSLYDVGPGTHFYVVTEKESDVCWRA